MVRKMLEKKPGIFRKVKYEYQLYDLADENLVFNKNDDGLYELHTVVPKLIFNVSMGGILSRNSMGLSISHNPNSCVGSKEQITDYCLLRWQQEQKDELYHAGWQKILSTVTGQSYGPVRDEWLQWRLKQGNWSNKNEWILDLMRSNSWDLASAAIKNSSKVPSQKARKVLTGIIQDENVRPDVRGKAMIALPETITFEAATTLVDLIDDDTPRWKKEYTYFINESYPFYDRPGIRMMREWIEKNEEIKAIKSSTLGNEALKALKKLTKKDFGKNKEAWRKWIKKHVKRTG